MLIHNPRSSGGSQPSGTAGSSSGGGSGGSQGFRLDPDSVRQDASDIQAAGQTLSDIGQQASGVHVGSDVYGLIARPFAAALQMVYQQIGSGITSFADSIAHVSDQLSGAVDQLEEVDSEHAEIMRQLGETIPDPSSYGVPKGGVTPDEGVDGGLTMADPSTFARPKGGVTPDEGVDGGLTMADPSTFARPQGGGSADAGGAGSGTGARIADPSAFARPQGGGSSSSGGGSSPVGSSSGGSSPAASSGGSASQPHSSPQSPSPQSASSQPSSRSLDDILSQGGASLGNGALGSEGGAGLGVVGSTAGHEGALGEAHGSGGGLTHTASGAETSRTSGEGPAAAPSHVPAAPSSAGGGMGEFPRSGQPVGNLGGLPGEADSALHGLPAAGAAAGYASAGYSDQYGNAQQGGSEGLLQGVSSIVSTALGSGGGMGTGGGMAGMGGFDGTAGATGAFAGAESEAGAAQGFTGPPPAGMGADLAAGGHGGEASGPASHGSEASSTNDFARSDTGADLEGDSPDDAQSDEKDKDKPAAASGGQMGGAQGGMHGAGGAAPAQAAVSNKFGLRADPESFPSAMDSGSILERHGAGVQQREASGEDVGIRFGPLPSDLGHVGDSPAQPSPGDTKDSDVWEDPDLFETRT